MSFVIAEFVVFLFFFSHSGAAAAVASVGQIAAHNTQQKCELQRNRMPADTRKEQENIRIQQTEKKKKEFLLVIH